MSFTTECAAVTLPYTYGFEKNVQTTSPYSTSYPYPKCWERVVYQSGSYGNYSYYPYVHTATYSQPYAHGGNGANSTTGHSMRFYQTSASTNECAVLPEISDDFDMDKIQIRFWAAVQSSQGTLKIGIMDSPTNAGSFTSVQEVTVSNTYSNGFQEFTVPFSTYIGTGRYIAFMCGTGSSYAYFLIDDITVELIPTCWVPTALTVKETSYNSASLTWNAGKDETEWNIQYKKSSESEWGNSIHVTSLPTNENPYVLTGLKRGTDYDVRVQAYCDADDQSEWCNSISFTTDCSIWPIDNANALFEDFSGDAFPPACWNWIKAGNNYGWMHSTNVNDPLDPSGTAYSYWPTGESYLILPHMQIDGDAVLSFEMAFTDSGSGEESSVVLSTTGFDKLNFTNTLWTANTFPTTRTNVNIDLSDYYGQDVYIAFKYVGVGTSGRTWYVDNVQVYVADNVFTTEGEWNNSSNWSNGTPTSTQSVHIDAPVTITNNVEVGNVTVGTGSITIAEGGQLKHNNEDVVATIQKSITGYNRGGSNWYLIAHPMNDAVNVSANTDLTDGTYDLYAFDESKDGEQWRNYKVASNNFTKLETATGYLYANGTGGTFNVTGTLNSSDVDIERQLVYTSGCVFAGWNLVGNPFACNAYVKDATNNIAAYYRMNEAGNGFTAATGAIAPMEGILVQATAIGQSFKFTRTAPNANAGKGNLNISLAQTVTNRGAKGDTDNAIVRFDGGNTLEKFSFRDNTAKVYIPQDGKDYAVVSAENQGVMPVNFKASENGNYTLSFTTENVAFSYLHLIDNMTGNDVDLLATPSYNFDARYTDYASRFKLVFAKADNGDSEQFAFISNGELILSGVDGNSTVQIVDVTGRILSSTTGTSHLNTNDMAAGVYVLRLINGENVQTQKIVVK